MTKIKFGTDGWRAIIAKDFTVDNVARVTLGSVEWLKQNFDNPSVVVGHDCRYAGELFAETTAKVFANAGIKVLLAKGCHDFYHKIILVTFLQSITSYQWGLRFGQVL